MTRSQLRLLLGYIRRQPLVYLSGFAAALAGVTALAINPLLIRQLLDDVLPGGVGSGIALTVLGIAAVQFFHRLMVIVNRIFRELGDQAMGHDIRCDLLARVFRQDGYFFDRNSTGHLVQRFTTDLRRATFSAQVLVLKGFLSTFELIAALVAAFLVNTRLGLVLLAFAPVLYVAMMILKPIAHAANRTERAAASGVRAYVHEALEGVRLIRTVNGQQEALQELHELNRQRLEEGSFKVAFARQLIRKLWGVASALGVLAVFVVAVLEVQAGLATAGTVAAFVQIAMTYFIGLSLSAEYLADFERLAAPWQAIAPMLDEGPRVTDGQRSFSLTARTTGIDVESVSFRYSAERLEPIRGVSLQVSPGEFVGIVGPSGSGKTTLADLVLRHYDTDAGRVLVNGQDIRTLVLSDLRREVGIVPQEAVLLNVSIRDNLRIARPEASDDEVAEAMRNADLHDFVMTLPAGYDTVVGDRGVRLSGGQRQRVAIARVFLQDPPILLLDEATASLDSLSEQRIQAALSRVRAFHRPGNCPPAGDPAGCRQDIRHRPGRGCRAGLTCSASCRPRAVLPAAHYAVRRRGGVRWAGPGRTPRQCATCCGRCRLAGRPLLPWCQRWGLVWRLWL